MAAIESQKSEVETAREVIRVAAGEWHAKADALVQEMRDIGLDAVMTIETGPGPLSITVKIVLSAEHAHH